MTYMFRGEFKATGVTYFRNNLKKALDEVYENQLTLIVTRPEDHNVVVISEDEFNQMKKEIDNLNYLLKLAKSDQQIESGETYVIDIDSI
ncbi:MAG: type II toxin-antitoxin system Phd/YefM family antitoxin [Erysipelothrix sp.]|nr:type II toxin-antitoxin system Phd/YefM family antitoxin [Erysipelothrix sp.]